MKHQKVHHLSIRIRSQELWRRWVLKVNYKCRISDNNWMGFLSSIITVSSKLYNPLKGKLCSKLKLWEVIKLVWWKNWINKFVLIMILKEEFQISRWKFKIKEEDQVEFLLQFKRRMKKPMGQLIELVIIMHMDSLTK